MPKISSLSNTATVVNSNDWFVIEQGGVTKKVAAQYVTTATSGGGGGGGGTAKVFISSYALGGVSAGALSFFEVSSVCQRGLVSFIKIIPNNEIPYDVRIFDAGSETANKMLLASDIYGIYEASIPWYFESASGSSMRIGIKNRSGISTNSFTLNSLRVEKFA